LRNIARKLSIDDEQSFMSGRRTQGRGGSRTEAAGPILIVDDDADDALLTKRAIQSMYPDLPIRIIESGKSLVAYLERQSASSDVAARSLASAIMLDLKMPEMDGFAVLEWIKGQPKYADIPVIVVTVFEDLPHLKRAYALRACSYLLKPIDAESFHNAMSSLNIPIL
jgi:CheY-like chemotaxis protein